MKQFLFTTSGQILLGSLLGLAVVGVLILFGVK